ncbi:hypothetical protein STENM327S_07318 [Streptomyces tendae]
MPAAVGAAGSGVAANSAVRPLLLGLPRLRGALGVAVRVREQPAQHRVGGRLVGLGEQLGERVVGGVLGGSWADQLQELHGQGADDGDLDVVELAVRPRRRRGAVRIVRA